MHHAFTSTSCKIALIASCPTSWIIESETSTHNFLLLLIHLIILVIQVFLLNFLKAPLAHGTRNYGHAMKKPIILKLSDWT